MIMPRRCDQCFAFLDVLEESWCCSAVLFMIVSFPEDAAAAICCSIDRVCLAVRAFRAAASLTRAGFLGGCTRFPFLGCGALDDCLDDGTLLCNPFVLPCTISVDQQYRRLLNLEDKSPTVIAGTSRCPWEPGLTMGRRFLALPKVFVT